MEGGREIFSCLTDGPVARPHACQGHGGPGQKKIRMEEDEGREGDKKAEEG